MTISLLEKKMNLNHSNVSFAKSSLRIAAGVFLIFSDVVIAGALLILAEVLGVLEELV
jgi:hypothetical protein